MVYNIYTNVNAKGYQFWDIQSNSSVGVRNARYKLLHTFTGNGYDDWFDYTVALTDDGDLEQKPCSQMNSGSSFEYFLFDLVKDPYETTNLYYNDNYASVRVRRQLLFFVCDGDCRLLGLG